MMGTFCDFCAQSEKFEKAIFEIEVYFRNTAWPGASAWKDVDGRFIELAKIIVASCGPHADEALHLAQTHLGNTVLPVFASDV